MAAYCLTEFAHQMLDLGRITTPACDLNAAAQVDSVGLHGAHGISDILRANPAGQKDRNVKFFPQ
jgi:hypothetical protein